jgi:hypothetical protein
LAYLASSSTPTWHHWIKVRHALKFSLRRKPIPSTSQPLIHADRCIPTISVSLDSDDEHASEQGRKAMMKESINRIDDHTVTNADETDLDDESMLDSRTYRQQRNDNNEIVRLFGSEHQQTSFNNVQSQTSTIDDEVMLTRKQSKIGKFTKKKVCDLSRIYSREQ